MFTTELNLVSKRFRQDHGTGRRRARDRNKKQLGRSRLWLETLEPRLALSSLLMLTPEDGTGADALVRDGAYANSNFGSTDVLSVKLDGTSYARKAYIRFDAHSLGVSSFGQLTLDAASLTLTSAATRSSSATISVFGLIDGSAGEQWSESTITWNNAPANDTASPGNLTGEATLLGTFTDPPQSSGDVHTFNAAALKSFLQNDTNGVVTLILTRQGEAPPPGSSGSDWASKEHTTLAPVRLELTGALAEAGGPYTVAEGGSVKLAGIGADAAPLTFAWDLDGDGIYGESGAAAVRGDETGKKPTFFSSNIDGPGSVSVALRVTDNQGTVAQDTVTVQVTEAAPVANPGGPYETDAGNTVALAGAGLGFGDAITAYAWDLDGDGVFGETGGAAERGAENVQNPVFVSAGLAAPVIFPVRLKVTDADGSVSAAATSQVNVRGGVPTALAGGPYTVEEGGTVKLSPLLERLTWFGWDLDGDGWYGESGAAAARGDETVANPVFDTAGINGPTTVTVDLWGEDDSNDYFSTATINVTDIAEASANAGGPYSVAEGRTVALVG